MTTQEQAERLNELLHIGHQAVGVENGVLISLNPTQAEHLIERLEAAPTLGADEEAW